jgi:uridine kinase
MIDPNSFQIFCEADADTCLSRRSMIILNFASQATDPSLCAVLRDVSERGRDIEGCIKQWFGFVKPNFERYVEPQRKVAGKLPFPFVVFSNSMIHRHHRAKRR